MEFETNEDREAETAPRASDHRDQRWWRVVLPFAGCLGVGAVVFLIDLLT